MSRYKPKCSTNLTEMVKGGWSIACISHSTQCLIAKATLAHPRQSMPKRILGHCISVQWIDIASTKSIAGPIRSSGFAPSFV